MGFYFLQNIYIRYKTRDLKVGFPHTKNFKNICAIFCFNHKRDKQQCCCTIIILDTGSSAVHYCTVYSCPNECTKKVLSEWVSRV